jgi:hypothetical protein
MILSVIHVIAGISWDPEIRGALTVVVGSAVLMGSIWLIMATNMGNRLGTLNALAGFFGWILIMGLVWWIYGGNVLKGDDPSWVPRETVFGDLAVSTVGDVSDLSTATLPAAPSLVAAYCPGLVDATELVQRARIVENNLDIPLEYDAPEGRPYCDSEPIGELLAVDVETITESIVATNDELGPEDPRYRDDAALAVLIETTIDDEQRKVSQLTLTGLVTASPELVAAASANGDLDSRGWNIVSSAEAGEAQATAGAFIVAEPDIPFDSADEFFILDTFQKGGKPERDGDSVWDRVQNEVRNTVIFWHPTNTTVVQVVRTLDKEEVPGQAPPFAEVDPDSQVVSIVMVRDLGSRRLPAAFITIGSLFIFLALSWMLHTRSLALRRRTAEWNPNAAT